MKNGISGKKISRLRAFWLLFGRQKVTKLKSRIRCSGFVILNLDPRIFNPVYLEKVRDF